MHQLKGSSEEQLNDQVHHDVHHSNVDEHVSDETPCLVSLPGIVDEDFCHGTTGAQADSVDVAVSVIAKREEQTLSEHESICRILLYSLILNDINDEENHFDDAEDDHGEWWREKLHLVLVGSI
jgi:hypothetical protein